jgi:serine/threonine-protein kinase
MSGISHSPLEQVACCHDVPDVHAPVHESLVVELHPGEILDDRFLIVETISHSGMASIFKAQDLHNENQPVAVKVPHIQFEGDPGFFTRFQREQEIGLKLNHPFILKFLPVTTPRSRPYIVTEYLRGCTLAHLLQAMRPLPEKDALKIASLIAEGLEYLHAHGVFHRDLKPQNIMICCDGTIRIMDFGIACATDMRRVTFTGFSQALGTPDYLAPEQVQGKRGDARTDIYSLGAILYEMLTGRTPFEGDNTLALMNARLTSDPVAPRQLNAALTPPAEEIVLHALARQPSDRYSSAVAMKKDLDDPAQVKVTDLCRHLQASTRWTRALQKLRWLSVCILLPLGLQVLLFLFLWHHHR